MGGPIRRVMSCSLRGAMHSSLGGTTCKNPFGGCAQQTDIGCIQHIERVCVQHLETDFTQHLRGVVHSPLLGESYSTLRVCTQLPESSFVHLGWGCLQRLWVIHRLAFANTLPVSGETSSARGHKVSLR